MLRMRIPDLDDERIYQLIVRRLIPFALKANPGLRFSRKEIKRRLNVGQVVVAADRGGQAIGFICYKELHGVLFIDMLAVDTAVQGKGLGSTLMDAAERYAWSRGLRTLQLAVDEPNTHAQSFYERKGYRIIQVMPGQKLYLMSKELF